jgi:hypothetical protein
MASRGEAQGTGTLPAQFDALKGMIGAGIVIVDQRAANALNPFSR